MAKTNYRLGLGIHLFYWSLLPTGTWNKGFFKFSFLVFTLEYRNKRYGY